MKYPAYPHYKDSGVAWLGEVPGHWESISLKWVSRLYAGGTPDKSNDSYWEDGHIPWLNSGSVNDGYITQPSALITHEGFLNSSAKWIPEKSLVIALAGQGKTKGMVAQLGIRATCNQSMAAIIPDSKVYSRYLYWWLTSNYQNIRNMAGGEQRDGLNLVMVGSIPCPLLPKTEQIAIADFLDRETGRIDTLVAKKRKLVELLKEKRSALISRTVTRGLPADAAREFGLTTANASVHEAPATYGRGDFNRPQAEANQFAPTDGTGAPRALKDSGVEWLGEIPTNWTTWKLGRICSLVLDGTHFSPENTPEGDRLYITAKNIKEKGIDLSNISYISEADHRSIHSRCPVTKGDVLYIKDGATAGIATVNQLCEEFSLLSSVALLRPKARLLESRYLAYQLNSTPFKGYVLNSLVGGAMTRFTLEIISKFRLIAPPLQEQTAIAAYLDRETAKIDRLIEKVETAMARLQEYRSALITAAVTGKIDVREAS